MAAKKPTARKRTAARRKKIAPRKSSVRKPARGGFMQRQAIRWATVVGNAAERHGQTTTSKRDAAIMRITHEGCPKCHGNGQIATHKKDGTLSGSKACDAKPTKTKASRLKVAMSSRFGADKRTGLIGWTCPCGKKEKPRYRDTKIATQALRTHERQKHGGVTVGGAWSAQVAEGAQPASKPTKVPAPVTKTDTSGTAMTDAKWEKQNTPISPATATKKGLCWYCGGKGALYSAFGGEHITTACPQCRGTGKSSAAHAAAARA